MGNEQAFGAALRQVKEAGLIPEDQVRLCAHRRWRPWIWKWVDRAAFRRARQIRLLPLQQPSVAEAQYGAECPLAGSDPGAPVLRRGHRRGVGFRMQPLSEEAAIRPTCKSDCTKSRQPSQGGIPIGRGRIGASLHLVSKRSGAWW